MHICTLYSHVHSHCHGQYLDPYHDEGQIQETLGDLTVTVIW